MSSDPSEPLYFWREFQPEYGFLSQWYDCPFEVDGVTYWHAEMWMMMQKAKLFNDDEAAEAIKKTKEPGQHQSIGRKVKGYNGLIWNEHKSRIVEEGNYHKFTKTEAKADLKSLLLATGDRELVEASPSDRIWGIGFGAETATQNRADWGQNLLGKAIMRVRDRLRQEEKK